MGTSVASGAFRGNLLDRESGKTKVSTARCSAIYSASALALPRFLSTWTHIVRFIQPCIMNLPFPARFLSQSESSAAFHQRAEVGITGGIPFHTDMVEPTPLEETHIGRTR